MKFYLGTHIPNWLGKTDIPLFVSQRTLHKRKTFPRAKGTWALDSGGFSELSMYGEWQTAPQEYANSVRRYISEIGNLEWAASQDWMCEPFIIAKTGLSVKEHQRKTIENYLELKSLAPDLPFIPVLQGWEMTDYERHAEDYMRANIDLRDLRRVGLGSVCRRQHLSKVRWLAEDLHSQGIKLHGFGVKMEGLRMMADELVSSDSMAWSFGARYKAPMAGHTHKTCANCLPYAEKWHAKVQRILVQPRQRHLWAA
jgi:hypothetical protein